MRNLLIEALVVALVGAVAAFSANGLRPRGIELRRDYFPPPTVPTAVREAKTSTPVPLPATNPPAAERSLLEELEARGLQYADSNRIAQLFHDPRYEQGLIVIIDARDEQHYLAGHIPGAYEFNYYAPTDYLPTVLPVCQIAEQILFYCNGGRCDDSLLAAVFLRDAAQIPKEKLFVYGGGFAEWCTNRMPVEIGPRKSGQLRESP